MHVSRGAAVYPVVCRVVVYPGMYRVVYVQGGIYHQGMVGWYTRIASLPTYLPWWVHLPACPLSLPNP